MNELTISTIINTHSLPEAPFIHRFRHCESRALYPGSVQSHRAHEPAHIQGCIIKLMDEKLTLHFDPLDHQQIKLIGSLPPEVRIRAMLDARELAVGLIRGRLRRRFPNLSETQLNLKVLEATTRVRW